jgi:type I restriction enzyme S subunit
MKKIKLKEVSEVITKGTTPTTIGKKFTTTGVNYIKSESITSTLYLNSTSYEFIDKETNEILKRSKLQENDLLFSIAGAYLGKIGVVRNQDLPANTNQAVGIVRLNNKKVNFLYIYYYFSQKYINRHINKLSSQSSQPNLNLTLLGNLEFDNKLLTKQKKIAKTLSALDSKIELNNRINSELEVMAKLLYDYWFVQFDFPDANGQPYKSSGGEMVYSEVLKRDVPKGWEVKSLDKFGKLKNGINYDPSEIGDTKAKIINVRNISSSSIFVANKDLDELNLDGENVRKYLVDRNSILITRSGIPGTVRLIEDYSANTIYCGFIICLTVNNNYMRNLLFFQLKSVEVYMAKKSGGTIMPNINQGVLKGLSIISPIKKITEEFNIQINPIFKKINLIEQENQQLKALRDWLLPMLMNGQVEVMESSI